MAKKDLNEIKEQPEKINEEVNGVKVGQKNEVSNNHKCKESLWKKAVVFLIIIVIFVGIGYLFSRKEEVVLLPENSVTIVVKDEVGKPVDGTRIKLIGKKHYGIDYKGITEYTLLQVEPNDYLLTFEIIPDGYICEKTTDNFTLIEGGNVKLEYNCSKQK